EAVARRRVVEEDEVAALLAAEVVARAAHLLDDVAVADGRADEAALGALEGPLEAEVAHHGRDEGALLEALVADHPRRAHGHDGVAVDLGALLVDDDHAVGVAVE